MYHLNIFTCGLFHERFFSECLLISPHRLDMREAMEGGERDEERGRWRESYRKNQESWSWGTPEESMSRKHEMCSEKPKDTGTTWGAEDSPVRMSPLVSCVLVWLRWAEELRGEEVQAVPVEFPSFETCERDRRNKGRQLDENMNGAFFHDRKLSPC